MPFDFYVVSNPSKTKLPSIDFGGNVPTAVSGFYKVILKWMKCFLTVQGSDASDLTYGTALADAVGGNVVSSVLVDLVYQAVSDTSKKIKEYQKGTSNKAERLASASLTNVVYNQGTSSIDVYVTLKNELGESLVLNLPTGIRTPPSSL